MVGRGERSEQAYAGDLARNDFTPLGIPNWQTSEVQNGIPSLA